MIGNNKEMSHVQVIFDPHAITQNVDVPVLLSWSTGSGTDPRFSPSESSPCGSVVLLCEAATMMVEEEIIADEGAKTRFLKRRTVVLNEPMAVEKIKMGSNTTQGVGDKRRSCP